MRSSVTCFGVLLFACLSTSGLVSAQGKSPAIGTSGAPLNVKVVSSPGPASFLGAPQMLKYGFTLGASAAFITPTTLGSHSHGQGNLAVTAMPYVAWIPYYHFLGKVSASYCATRALKLDREQASREANKYAEEIAADRWKERLKDNTGANDKPPADWPTLLDDAEWKIVQSALKNDDAFTDLESDTKVLATYWLVGWDTRLRGRCGVGRSKATRIVFSPLFNTWLGFYFGIPIPYSANFTADYTADGIEQEVSRKRNVRSRGSVGLVVAPVPYINLLVGFTSIVSEKPEPKIADQNQTRMEKSWQLTFAVGGTVDILGAALAGIMK